MKKVGREEDGAEPGAREGKKYSEKGKQRISWIYLTGSSNVMGIFFLLRGVGEMTISKPGRVGKKIEGKRRETKIWK